MALWLPERTKFRTIAWLASAIALLWIVGAAWLDMAPSAGRGGALALIVSLYLFFAGHDIALKAFALSVEQGASQEARVRALVRYVQNTSAAQERQNWYLTVPSMIATAAWGFGDLAAQWLRILWVALFG